MCSLVYCANWAVHQERHRGEVPSATKLFACRLHFISKKFFRVSRAKLVSTETVTSPHISARNSVSSSLRVLHTRSLSVGFYNSLRFLRLASAKFNEFIKKIRKKAKRKEEI